MKNTHGGVLLLVKLQALACNFNKSNTPSSVFFTFYKLYKLYQIAQSISSKHDENNDENTDENIGPNWINQFPPGFYQKSPRDEIKPFVTLNN